MSDEVAIKIEGLGKRYLIGHNSNGGRPKTFREALTKGVKGAFLSARNMVQLRQLVAGDQIEEFWALQDVNLEISKGDAVAVIGKNGAGKSTLLKVLSRITEPTTGRVEINGRIASLLEVGTGFHPELTGRENIFLNGAILGMSRREIQGKIDRIIHFAGVEKFIDTPVKRYSSGMYVRLAFSVAAHLDPDILIVDEVLAVGDAAFQRKCHNLMRELAKSGKTVLFVSHNLRSLRALCRSGIILEKGKIKSVGAIDQILNSYQDEQVQTEGTARLGPVAIRIKTECTENHAVNYDLDVTTDYSTSLSEMKMIVTARGDERVCVMNLQDMLKLPMDIDSQSIHLSVVQKSPRFVEGVYDVGLYIRANGNHYEELRIAKLNIPQPEGADLFYNPEVRGFVEVEFSGSLELQSPC